MLKKNDSIEPESGTAEQPPSQDHGIVRMAGRGLMQFVLMAIVLFFGLFGMNTLTDMKEAPLSRPPFQKEYPVETVIAKMGSFQPRLLVYGEVQAAEAVELRALVAGQIVDVNRNLKIGFRIGKGEELLRIDPFVYESERATVEANIRETNARIAENRARIDIESSRIRSLRDQLKLAENDLDRINSLMIGGTATAKQVEDRTLIVSQRRQAMEQAELNLIAEQSRLDQMGAVLERFKWARKQAERKVSDTVLRAPFTGIISQKNAAVGRLISANDMVVAMYNADRLDVRFTLTDDRFGRIQSDPVGVVGREVEIIWSVGGEEFRYAAVIDRISAQINSDRGGVEVIAMLREEVTDSALRPGAFVEVIVPDKAFVEHFSVPESALYENGTVYEVVDGQLVSREVFVHARDGNNVIITGAIEGGDEILATRIAEISDGLKVRAVNQKDTETPDASQ